MKKAITAIVLITIISALSVPVAAVICGVDRIPDEVIWLPHNIYSWAQYANLIISAFFTGFIFALTGWIFKLKILQKIYWIFIYWLTVFLTIVEIFCLSKFGLAISPPMTSIIADTNNILEVKGFFQTYFDLSSTIIILSLIAIGWLIWCYSEKIFNYVLKYKKSVICVLVFLMIFCQLGMGKIFGRTYNPPITKAIYCARYWYKVKSFLQKMSSDYTNNVEIIENNSDTPNIIFIIGESESRHFMGIYNNKYNSTPLCQKLVDSGNMFIFKDTISMKSSTAQVMTPLLSFMENLTETTDVTKFDSIVDVFNKAGYQSFWISNHEKITKDLSYATCMSNRCDYRTFTAKISGNTEFTSQFSLKDEVMLPVLDKYIKEKMSQKDKNLFIMHIMGSHIRYLDRYPEKFDHFKAFDIHEDGFDDNQKNLLAQYLNTIFYTDHIINEVIKRFIDKDAVLVYVSDHAEEMWQAGFQGHGPSNVSKYMVEIPMIIWTSDIYKEKRQQNIDRIKSALNKPFMTDNLVHVLLDIVGIKTKQYNPTKSAINKDYIPTERIVVNGIKYEELRH